jgi:hypothetical protein
MLHAIRGGLSFNLIHLDSGFKFDLFVAGRHPLGRDQLLHRRKVTTALLGGGPLEVNFGIGLVARCRRGCGTISWAWLKCKELRPITFIWKLRPPALVSPTY